MFRRPALADRLRSRHAARRPATASTGAFAVRPRPPLWLSPCVPILGRPLAFRPGLDRDARRPSPAPTALVVLPASTVASAVRHRLWQASRRPPPASTGPFAVRLRSRQATRHPSLASGFRDRDFAVRLRCRQATRRPSLSSTLPLAVTTGCDPLSPTHYEPIARSVEKTSTFLFLNFRPPNFQDV